MRYQAAEFKEADMPVKERQRYSKDGKEVQTVDLEQMALAPYSEGPDGSWRTISSTGYSG